MLGGTPPLQGGLQMPPGQQVSRQQLPGGQPSPVSLSQGGYSEQMDVKSTHSLWFAVPPASTKQMHVCDELQKVAPLQGTSSGQRESGA
jgi:hypothetical protein